MLTYGLQIDEIDTAESSFLQPGRSWLMTLLRRYDPAALRRSGASGCRPARDGHPWPRYRASRHRTRRLRVCKGAPVDALVTR